MDTWKFVGASSRLLTYSRQTTTACKVPVLDLWQIRRLECSFGPDRDPASDWAALRSNPCSFGLA